MIAREAQLQRAPGIHALVKAQGDRDNPGETIDTKGLLGDTSFGMYTFGENFSSLTDLMRRYQYVGSKTVTINIRGVTVSHLVRPYGMMPFVNSEEKRLLYAREGLHSLISTGYKFFRGGVRVKIVFYSDQSCPVLVYAQHRPDVVDYNVAAMTSVDRVIGQGYATHVQNITLNPIMTLEIPYYLDSIYGNIGHGVKELYTDAQRVSHLGRLFIHVKSAKESTLTYELYMAFADDAKFELFQGFLPVIFIDDQFGT
ncbi:MAG: capsid protein [Fushun Iflavirus 2]|nr:MAG: capsid protein [Fushun Iflavirus 2]